MLAFVQREVPMVAAFITALFAVLISFGVNLSSTQQTAILGLWAVIAGLIVRSQVSPKA